MITQREIVRKISAETPTRLDEMDGERYRPHVVPISTTAVPVVATAVLVIGAASALASALG
ncbi:MULTISPECIES: hypothetical protein [unclassified Streptomyces]|uniref:hypothetical protein n=1 Tax=unclassified Streptomyces TaxID=2593676 RepID=UPI0019062733|nr:hypothetical protein [Streptomyces sp. HSG2]